MLSFRLFLPDDAIMKTGAINNSQLIKRMMSKSWANTRNYFFLTLILVFIATQALATTNYIPDRYPLNGWNGHGGNGGGDSTGNRVDRMLACVAYPDRIHPSVVMCRGYYGRSVLAVWDWRDEKLTSLWVFDSKDGENAYSGQGNHNISVADVDGDGDLTRELLDGNHIDKYKGGRIFTTTIPTKHRIYTLMHDPQYRLAIATQNAAYNQPPNTSFFLGTGMKKAQIPAHSGKDLRTSFMHDSLKRTFNIHIPPSYDKTVQIPLVIALHGRGANGASMIILTHKGFNKLADQDGFIMVYPDGIELNWNDGRMDEEAKDRAHRENINDVGFISALIDSMIKDYNINPKLVYVTGISNGAIMSYRLACELSNKITAIAPVDGNIPNQLFPECSPSRPVSVLAINNTDDPLVPFEGGYIYGIRKINLGKVLSVSESVGFWVKRNMCSITPVVTEEPDRDPKDGTRVTCKQYINGIDGTEVILYVVDGGGHTWPGGFQYLPAGMIGKTCRDFDANEVIWSFFKKHSR